VAVFNFLQFFNLFSFNTIIEPFYAAEGKVDNFEKNARLLGTLGNPNNNSILFIFFFSLFFRKDQLVTKKSILFLALASVLIFMCLSRTSLFAFLMSLLISIVMVRPNKVVVFSLTAVFCIIFLILISTSNYVTNAFSINVLENTSLLYRIAIWYKLMLMILDKPFLGHAPYKEFFYNNHLFAESEFILTTWRYGFIGLLLYLIQIIGLTISSVRKLVYNPVLMMGICVFITAFTNNPLNHNTINLLFAACVGLFFIDQNAAEHA
jgi:O-antigen ligase